MVSVSSEKRDMMVVSIATSFEICVPEMCTDRVSGNTESILAFNWPLWKYTGNVPEIVLVGFLDTMDSNVTAFWCFICWTGVVTVRE